MNASKTLLEIYILDKQVTCTVHAEIPAGLFKTWPSKWNMKESCFFHPRGPAHHYSLSVKDELGLARCLCL